MAEPIFRVIASKETAKECDLCHKPNTELLDITQPGTFWDSEVVICQTCISKMFRSFSKKK